MYSDYDFEFDDDRDNRTDHISILPIKVNVVTTKDKIPRLYISSQSLRAWYFVDHPEELLYNPDMRIQKLRWLLDIIKQIHDRKKGSLSILFKLLQFTWDGSKYLRVYILQRHSLIERQFL